MKRSLTVLLAFVCLLTAACTPKPPAAGTDTTDGSTAFDGTDAITTDVVTTDVVTTDVVTTDVVTTDVVTTDVVTTDKSDRSHVVL